MKDSVDLSAAIPSVNGGPAGSPATIVCKSRQGRKAATVVNDSGAGMQLAGLPPLAATFPMEHNHFRLRNVRVASTTLPHLLRLSRAVFVQASMQAQEVGAPLT